MLLTMREQEVLSYMGKSFDRRAIAKELQIEKTTVDKHIEAIYRKFNVKDKVGATIFGIYFKILDLDRLIKERKSSHSK